MGKRHLRYGSVAEWMAAEDVPADFVTSADDRYINEYAELRRHLFAQHVSTLSIANQQKLSDGNHPSQSHSFASSAQPYCELLDSHLKALGTDAEAIDLGWYHGDRIVLTVTLTEADLESEEQLPWLFQGFEVLYVGSAKSQHDN